MFGRELRLPVDLTYGLTPDSEQSLWSSEEYVDRLHETLRCCFDAARTNLGRAALLRKQSYDIRVKETVYNVGDKVWYFCPRRYRNRSPKWQKNFTGPFEITRIIDSHTIAIRRNSRSKCIVVHRDKLKPVITLFEQGVTTHNRQENNDGDISPARSNSFEPNPEVTSDPETSEHNIRNRPSRRIRPPLRLNDYC
jgi:hypothetical protein